MTVLAQMTGSDVALLCTVLGAIYAVTQIGDRLWARRSKVCGFVSADPKEQERLQAAVRDMAQAQAQTSRSMNDLVGAITADREISRNRHEELVRTIRDTK